MLNDYLSNHFILHWWLLICGAIVTGALLWFLSGILLEIIYGFGRAIDFQFFKKKVGIADGKPYVFRFRYFFGAWWNLTGFGPNDVITTPNGHKWKGVRNHVILGKFVEGKEPPQQKDSDDDLSFLDDDE